MESGWFSRVWFLNEPSRKSWICKTPTSTDSYLLAQNESTMIARGGLFFEHPNTVTDNDDKPSCCEHYDSGKMVEWCWNHRAWIVRKYQHLLGAKIFSALEFGLRGRLPTVTIVAIAFGRRTTVYCQTDEPNSRNPVEVSVLSFPLSCDSIVRLSGPLSRCSPIRGCSLSGLWVDRRMVVARVPILPRDIDLFQLHGINMPQPLLLLVATFLGDDAHSLAVVSANGAVEIQPDVLFTRDDNAHCALDAWFVNDDHEHLTPLQEFRKGVLNPLVSRTCNPRYKACRRRKSLPDCT